MRKNLVYLIFLSLILGIIITLFTGLFSWPGIVGATWWGYPFRWMSKLVVGPDYTAPLVISWDNLIIDFIFWSILILLILLFFYRKEAFNRFR